MLIAEELKSSRGLAAIGSPRHTTTAQLFFRYWLPWLFISGVVVIGGWLIWNGFSREGLQQTSNWTAPAPLDADRAWKYLNEICQLGPRPSGSQAMLQMQQRVVEHCEKLGARVERQTFTVRHPENGQPVEMTNLIVRWLPDLSERVLLCAHYDTRPFPDQDPVNPRGVFIGANDGGSGVALLMEIAHALESLSLAVGVDFVLFDGEEFLFNERRDKERYFQGSTHFARQVASGDFPVKYRAGILVDMIADKQLDLYYEKNSHRFAPELNIEIWKIAEKLKIREFRPRQRHEIRDDHLKLNEIAKIKVIDLIDFDYPSPVPRIASYWHTQQDLPENCSGESICKVAAVLLEWLKSLKKSPAVP